jgi:hypothetical protein
MDWRQPQAFRLKPEATLTLRGKTKGPIALSRNKASGPQLIWKSND